jgi:hypothetical protein
MIAAKSKKSLILLSAVLVISLFSATISVHAQLQGQTVSTVYVSPTSTCCGASGPYQAGNQFSVVVNLKIPSGLYVSAFDVRLNYTNPHTSYAQGVLNALSVDYSNNIFASYQARGEASVTAECINGISVLSTGSGCTGEIVGQVHLTEALLGQKLSGPLDGPLFSILFNVTGASNSIFVVDRADIVNPTPDPANPQVVNPQFIPVLTLAGVFGNSGVIAFFNFQPSPSDLLISPAILPNHTIPFDASGSFVSYNTSIPIVTYSWSFGDGSPTENKTISSDFHSFALPGNYTVSLKVWDSKNEMGQLGRRVSVVPALGAIALTVDDQSGTAQRGNVQVRVFNASSSPAPFVTRTVNQLGGVLFSSLSPGDYYLTFSGQGIVNSSKKETVIPGFTTTDTIYLSSTPPSADYAGLIYTGAILGAIGVFGGAIIYQKRKSRKRSVKARGGTSTKVKTKNVSRNTRQS